MKERISSPEVVGVGYATIDYVGMVPHFPSPDTKVRLQDFKVDGGGPVATALVTASRLGARVGIVAKVGDDDRGEAIKATLARENVDVEHVSVQKEASSQISLILVERDTGARTILWGRGDVSLLEPSEIPREYVSGCRVLLADSHEVPGAIGAAEIARDVGIPVVLDAGSATDGINDLLPLVTHCVASQVFPRQLTGNDDPRRSLREIMRRGPQVVVSTMGPEGCVLLRPDGELEYYPAFDVDVVDTTGAGDVFHGAIVFGILRGWELGQVIEFSSAVAALKCTRMGGREGIPTLEVALDFLEKKRGLRPPDSESTPSGQ